MAVKNEPDTEISSLYKDSLKSLPIRAGFSGIPILGVKCKRRKGEKK